MAPTLLFDEYELKSLTTSQIFRAAKKLLKSGAITAFSAKDDQLAGTYQAIRDLKSGARVRAAPEPKGPAGRGGQDSTRRSS
ncbi:MAG: hypothetical protein AABZ35_06880 [Gemmatimonadota bacterium]